MKGKYTKIIKIERIQNELLYKQYVTLKKSFKERLRADTEKLLYHGCSQDAANSIIEDWFKRNFAGSHGKREFYFLRLLHAHFVARYVIWRWRLFFISGKL
jgi:hypothetical protein